MRLLTAAFAERLQAETTTLCWCWQFVRRDGQTFGATDHDRPVAFDGLDHAPAHGLDMVELTSGSGFAPGRASASGALDAAFMTDADLGAGRWDGARVDVWRVDWQEPAHRVLVWSGRLSEVAREGAAFRAELVSLKADLERPIGRVYARACDAEPGDARCGVALSDPAFRAEGHALEVSGAVVTASGLETHAPGWFAGGVLTWASGAARGLAARILRQTGARLELAGPVGSAGDAFVATAGCDRSFETCGAKFANRDNFRGFPHLPGPDAVLAGPAAGADGGRRA